ncbi:MAG: DUF1064 domain-containing protein [Cypionkella sp.]|nr:DUF1064 domain-containing protein [Cypionkella sp.]
MTAQTKYRAKPQIIDGIRFASKKEAKRYTELMLLQRLGEIRNLRLQVPIMLEGRDGPVRARSGRQMRLTVDFAYEDRLLNWATVFEDSKGYATRDYEVRKGVAEARGYRILET